VKCPYQDYEYSCDAIISEREIRGVWLHGTRHEGYGSMELDTRGMVAGRRLDTRGMVAGRLDTRVELDTRGMVAGRRLDTRGMVALYPGLLSPRVCHMQY